MVSLQNKRVVLGITGGIAAYKGAELTRRLSEAGADVRVVMSQAATQFIAPLTLQALSGKPVHQHLLDDLAESAMGHIELARWADVIAVAPATAHFMARLAQGLADDLLTTLCLASRAPLVLAPAMNRVMWESPATQANVRLLTERGVRLVGPAAGEQACGETGPGRMVEAVEILGALAALFIRGRLQARRVLITAGPTREAIDPVRYISNRSSGKMGYALASAAAEAGAKVILVSGPVALACPDGVERVAVESAADMRAAVLTRAGAADIVIAAAAVADYTPVEAVPHKMKKGGSEWQLSLRPTADIVAELALVPGRPFLVAFAAETEELERNARGKLEAKGVDLVAANWVGRPGQGFDSNENALTVIWRGGSVQLPLASKSAVARQLIEIIAERYHDKNSA